MEDEYVVEEFSEDEYNSSSSDDDDIQTFIKKEYGLIEVEDDFEAEVDKVMTAHLQKLNSEQQIDITYPTPSCSNENDKKDGETKKTQAEINDELFYDPHMDEDDEKWINDKRRSYIFPSKEVSKSKVKPLPNSDAVLNCPACLSLLWMEIYKTASYHLSIFYDPNMDEDDEKWINDKRRSYIFPSKEVSKSKVKPLPNSDAVLNCPACLSLLCLDCQRHDIYKSQYRAMFVTNCTVIDTETLNYPNKKKSKKVSGEMSAKPSDVYNPVKCSICNTEVAVYDTDEIYHFFNVIASY